MIRPRAALLSLCVLLTFAGCSKPPETPPPAPPAAPQASPDAVIAFDFSGTWTTTDDQGQAFDLVVFPGGRAVSTWVKGTSRARGERGFWRTEGDRLVLVFEDGWTDEILRRGDEFLHRGFEPGADLSGRWKNEAAARRIEGDAFTGVWQLNKEPDGSYLYVTLQSSGRAFSTASGGTEGRWEVTTDGALCVWPDGWNDLIFPAQDGYQKRSWVGPAEQNATPPDISSATRVGSGKFSITP